MKEEIDALLSVLSTYKQMGIAEQIDYQKFYLYSLITHSTAIEGSTVTEVENQLLFDEGMSAPSRPMIEQLMNLDLKRAYDEAYAVARKHPDLSVDLLKSFAACVMYNTGSKYSTLMGDFDSSKGDLRLVNVTAGAGGRSYMHYQKVPTRLEAFCQAINERRKRLLLHPDETEAYLLSFDAHLQLVTIHPWVDGNGRMARLLMNYLQYEMGLIPTKILQEHKAAYIQALIDSREEESTEPFRRFMLQEHTHNLQNEIQVYRQSLDDDLTF